jgi:hypothetical protein
VGLEDVEWYESPTSDEELINLAKALSPPVKSKDTGGGWVRKSTNWGWFKWSLWFLAWLFAAPWALVFGLLAVVLCITVVGIPFGFVVMVIAGLPGATLIGLAWGQKGD